MQVWDICIKAQIFALTGHDNTICSVFTRPVDPKLLLALMTQPSSFGTSDSEKQCLLSLTIKSWCEQWHRILKRIVLRLLQLTTLRNLTSRKGNSYTTCLVVYLYSSQQKTIINAMWLSMWRVCWPQEVTMAVFGSGIGRVITIFSKPKQLYNLAHWIVKLESMLHATT
ncbi:protein pleiotropic regulatory locus 1-like isoform X5 [Carya illinoinensis]|uniref:protein pleiotropic regulatory locus 1-like isoform X5 n=1 Tax=Carya illinoinensis TaxID=32201 RepID=UPI001C720CEE|nr:protein pleiotropic regulatory locus 1-like isoform X5 [Carya illinoinensis]